MKISNKEKIRLEKIAKQNKVTVAIINKEYEEEYNTLKERGVEENIDRLAVNAVLNRYRRKKQKQSATWQPKAKAEAVYGFIVGDMGMRDRAEEIRRKCKRYIEAEGVQAAIDAQLINGDNRILDTRETIYGRENPNYLEPLDKEIKGKIITTKIRSRVLFGFFRKNGSKVFKFTSLQTSDNKLAKAWDKIKFFTPCQTFAIVKEEDNTDMKLNSSQAEGTTTIFKALKEDWDIDKIIMDSIKTQLTKIQNVEKHFDSFKDVWDRRIFLRGVVAWINTDRPSPWGSINMSLMDSEDEEATVKVQIGKAVPIDFGELSEVIVFGRTNEDKYRDKETGKLEVAGIRVNAFGVYPIPGLITPKDAGEVEDVDEEEIEGWLD